MTSVEARPEVEVLGTGDPVAAIVGGVHGDEPCGIHAIKQLREAEAADELTFERAVKLVIANPPALQAKRRFVDVDMNRTFPGDRAGNSEERLAAIVCAEVADVPTLALHSTQSQAEPFAFADPRDATAMRLAAAVSVPNLVLAPGDDIGALSTCGSVLTVEAGLQGSDGAAASALALSIEFLQAMDVLPGEAPGGSSAVYRIGEQIDKPAGERYEVLVDNFSEVAAGQPYARVDGRPQVADTPFHPILLSAGGYRDIFGFRGERVADSIEDSDVTPAESTDG